MSQKHYYITQWAGMDNFQCKYCPYATLEGEDAINDHARKHFETEAPAGVLVADKRGKEQSKVTDKDKEI